MKDMGMLLQRQIVRGTTVKIEVQHLRRFPVHGA